MGSWAQRAGRLVCGRPLLVAVFVAGVLIRAALIPITYGDDFIVWNKATLATLHGVNVYAHHPGYPHGPFAYFPLFLYVELPFQWLAQHSAIPFTVLGKLPILAADIGCLMVLTRELRRRGHREQTVAIGGAAFFLNPLVIYNSAWYGRFDSVGCLLLFVALCGFARQAEPAARTVVWWALAIAAKTYPAFILAGVLRRARHSWRRVLLVLAGVLVVISLPYVGDVVAYGHDIVFYNIGRAPLGLSWQRLTVHLVGESGAKIVSYVLLAGFAAGTVWLTTRVQDIWRYTTFVLVLFLLCSKLVLEQYLIWLMPSLILLALATPSRLARASLGLLGLFTVVGMIGNESFHPLGRSPLLVNLILAVCCVGYLVIGLREPDRQARESVLAASSRAAR